MPLPPIRASNSMPPVTFARHLSAPLAPRANATALVRIEWEAA